MLSHSCAIHALPHFKIRSSSQSKTLGSTLNRKTNNLQSPWVNFPSQDYVLAKEKKNYSPDKYLANNRAFICFGKLLIY